jgi:hypothetical protein
MIAKHLAIGLVVPVLLLMSCCQECPQVTTQKPNLRPHSQLVLQAVVKATNIQTGNCGTATCIYKETTKDGVLVLYFLTADHITRQKDVVDLGLVKVGKYRHIRNVEMKLCCWQYDRSDRRTGHEDYKCQGWLRFEQNDLAILKLSVKKPTKLLLNMPTIELATVKEFDNIRVGEETFCIGCPYGLPPVYLSGNVARFNCRHQDSHIGKYIDTILITMDLVGGVSGAGVYDKKTGKLIGLAVITWDPGYFVAGVIPVTSIIKELKQVELGKKILGGT